MDSRSATPIFRLLMLIAASAIGFAIHLQGGEYTPLAMALVTVALLALTAAIIFPAKFAFYRVSDNWIDLAFAVVLTAQLFALYIRWPLGVDHRGAYLGPAYKIVYLALTAIVGFVLLLGYADLPPARGWWFPAVLIIHSLLAFWVIRCCPLPHIDVWYFQEDGARVLLHGANPYDPDQAHFRDIYDSTLPGHQQVYGDDMVVNGCLRFGFPYPPLSLYLSTLGVLLGGDARYAQAIALMLAGALIGYSGPGRRPKLAAAVLLFTPSVWLVLGRSWTEPFVVLFLAATVFCAARRWRWITPIAFGLLLASKQYLLLAIPLSFLLVEGFDWRRAAGWRRWGMFLLIAAGTAAIVTLPLALLDFRNFWHSTVTVQAHAPFRWDALSYLVWIGLNIDSKYTAWSWLAFVMAALALATAIRRSPRGPAGFASALALIYLVFIAFNKQAFCNYYFFVIGALAAATIPCNISHHFLQHAFVATSAKGPSARAQSGPAQTPR